MLKMLESPQIEEPDFSPERRTPSPPRGKQARQREDRLVNTPVVTASEKTIKESIWGELPRLEREDYKCTTSLVLPTTEASIQGEEEPVQRVAKATVVKGEQCRKRGIPNNGNTCYM